VTAICRLCEPIAFMSIFPYAYRMIESFNITQDETQVSVYAGMLITAFAFAEFSTGMIWGRISDRVGRKPVLIMGLVGTAMSMICFGFAKTLPGAIMARALGGLLNGNVGVLQTTVAELVTKKEHQPRAYSVMPVVWSIGSIIGPSIGGALAMPCDNLGWPRGGLFDEYPFLLPNLFCVAVLLLGITIGILFLEETHADKKGEPDFGRKLAEGLFKCGSKSRLQVATSKSALVSEEHLDFIDNDPPPGYRTMESSPLLRSASTTEIDAEMLREKESRGVTKTFSRQVILIVVAYAFLA
jgi:MFS family permease